MLKNEVSKLEDFYQLIKKENDKIESALDEDQSMQEQMNKRSDISDELKNSQLLYNSLNQALASADKTETINELFKSIKEIKIENQSLMKEYSEEK